MLIEIMYNILLYTRTSANSVNMCVMLSLGVPAYYEFLNVFLWTELVDMILINLFDRFDLNFEGLLYICLNKYNPYQNYEFSFLFYKKNEIPLFCFFFH